MFVTALTGRASILIRPPELSSAMFSQAGICSGRVPWPAQPEWIFHGTAAARATWLGAPTPPPLAAVVAVAAPPLGAFCDRHAVTNAPSPESERYFRNPRRFSAGMSKETPPLSSPTGRRRGGPPHPGEDQGSFDAGLFALSRPAFRLALRERGRTDREDLRKVLGAERPGLAFIGARPEIPRRTTEIDGRRIKPVGGHPLTQDLEPRAARKSAGETLPALPGVPRTPDRRSRFGREALGHRQREHERRLGVAWVQRHGEAEIAGKAGADLAPAAIRAPVRANVVLLRAYARHRWMRDEVMDAAVVLDFLRDRHHRAGPAVRDRPGAAAVGRGVDAGDADAGRDPLRVGRVERDRVESLPARARAPLVLGGMGAQ